MLFGLHFVRHDELACNVLHCLALQCSRLQGALSKPETLKADRARVLECIKRSFNSI
jgi:hypothetical protein